MDLMQFARSVIGVPFLEHGRDRAGLDCWGLIVLAYREVHGITLPDLGEHYDRAAATPELADLVLREQLTCWQQVEEPRPSDVVILRITGLPVHCAVVMDGSHMLHVHQTVDTCLERWRGLSWQRRLDGFFRHADLAA